MENERNTYSNYKACPSCGAKNSPQSIKCFQCGNEMQPASRRFATLLQCPICGNYQSAFNKQCEFCNAVFSQFDELAQSETVSNNLTNSKKKNPFRVLTLITGLLTVFALAFSVYVFSKVFSARVGHKTDLSNNPIPTEFSSSTKNPLPTLSPTKTPTPTSTPYPYGIWHESYYVDSFGDKTDQEYVYAYATGTFDNSAVTGRKLKIEFLFDKNKSCIQLYEYGDNLVKGYSSKTIYYDIVAKTSSGKTVKFSGSLEKDWDRIKISEYKSLYNTLSTGGIIKFYIERNDRKIENYSFSIDSTGFKQIFDKHWSWK